MKRIAILQSNYVPWKGYFDIIAAVDEFIIYDDMQYTKRDWRNRNQIKTPAGLQWITIPVYSKSHQQSAQRIRDTEITDADWAKAHWKTIMQNYRKAPYYEEVAALLGPLYSGELPSNLSRVNRLFIEAICNYIGIKAKISNSWEYSLADGKTERLVNLCLQVGGTEYISGPAAKDYVDEELFYESGLKLTWHDYSGYPEYPQLWGDFLHNVSILDLLFNCGKNSPSFMKHALV